MADPFFTVYTPDFCSKYADHIQYPPQDFSSEYAKLDWITDGLREEIIECSFNRDTDCIDGDPSQRNPEQFEIKCLRLFPAGRVFASSTQLFQTAQMFLQSWAVKPTHPGKVVRCFFSSPHNRKDRCHMDPSKRRKIVASPKKQVKCPFQIAYSLVKFSKKDKLPKHYYQAKVTSVNPSHSCEMNPLSHRQALQKSGDLQPNLVGVSSIVNLLRIQPNLPSHMLRPMLEGHVPSYKGTDAMFLCNFRARVNKFILENPQDIEVTEADVAAFTSTAPLSAANEMVLGDNVLAQKNLSEMLRRVLQEGGDIWDAIAFLEQVKDSNPGTFYRVKYDQRQRPEAICWILPEMRQDLIRYGNVLFLDACKKDLNRPGWPYIGPAVKDSENKVRVVSECLCLAESHEMYEWVLRTMHEDPGTWTLDKVRLIFADQLVTYSLLHSLEIDSTCVLYGDYFHLMNKVFPEKFGNRFNNIRVFLRGMLDGTQEEWQSHFEMLKSSLLDDPEKLSELEEIYSNPDYYSSWTLHGIEGNMYLLGSAAAEQNHSSLGAHLTDGGNFSISEQIKRLIDRHVHLSTKRQESENNRRLARSRFRSPHPGQLGSDENECKKNLSHFAFTLVVKSMKARLQSRRLGDTVHVWSSSRPFDEMELCDKHVSFSVDERCKCQQRLAWGIQCAHEYCWDGRFILEKVHRRWWNQETLNRLGFDVVEFDPNTSSNNPDCDDRSMNDDERTLNSNPGDFPSNSDSDSDMDDQPLTSLASRHPILSYQSVLGDCETLLKLVSRSPSHLQQVSDIILAVTNRIRNSKSVSVTFENTTNLEDITNSNAPTRLRGPDSQIPNARLGFNPNARRTKRYRSRHEIRQEIASRKRNQRSDDLSQVSTNVRTKTCGICSIAGHQRASCPRITMWNTVPLTGNDRAAFVTRLLSGTSFTMYPQDARPSASSFPRGTVGLVLHQCTANDSVICTVLGPKAEVNETYSKYPFQKQCVANFIAVSKQKIILNCLQPRSDTGWESFGLPEFAGYSQLSQLTQNTWEPTATNIPEMGYGLERSGML